MFSGSVFLVIFNLWFFFVCIFLMLLFIFLVKFYLRLFCEIRRIEVMICSFVYFCIVDIVVGLEVIWFFLMEEVFIK